MVDTVLLFARVFFSTIMFFVVMSNLSSLHRFKKNEWALMIVFTFVLSIGDILFNLGIFAVFLLVFFMVGLSIFKQISIAYSLLNCVLTFIIILSIQSGISVIYSAITNVSPSEIVYDEAVYWTVVTISSILAYILSKLLGHLLYKFFNSSLFKMMEENKKRISAGIYIVVALLFLIIFVSSFLVTYVQEINILIILNSILALLILLLIIVACYFFFKHLYQGVELKHNRELLENLQAYNSGVENLYTELRHFRHDTVNILSAAYKFIENNDFEGWKVYFEKEVSPLYADIDRQSDLFKQIEKITSQPVKGLLILKILKAIDTGCLVTVGIDMVENIGINDVDLIRILGILFDNAIEEGRNETGTTVKFALYNSNEAVTILLKNSFFGEPPNISVIFQKGYSTKGKGRGVGLHDLTRLTEKYDNVFLQTYIEDGEIAQELTIENPKEFCSD